MPPADQPSSHPHAPAILLALAVVFLAAAPARAELINYVGASPSWSLDSNWNLSRAPVQNDTVNITKSGASVNYDPANSPIFSIITIDSTSTTDATPTLNITPSSPTFDSGILRVGYDHKGAIVQTGGIHNASSWMGAVLGANTGANGAYTLSGTGAILNVESQLLVGDSGSATFTHTAGTVNINGALAIGSSPGSVSSYSFASGALNTIDLQVAPYGGIGAFTHSGGAASITGELSIGNVNGSSTGSAVYTHSGGSINAAALNIRKNGTLTHTGGTLKTAQLTIDLAGGKLDLTNQSMVVDYSASTTTPLASIVAAIVSGAGSNRTWTGPGIISSSAASNNGLTGIGYAEASDLFSLASDQTASWQGVTIDSSSVLVRYTKTGDADLDGSVNLNDLIRLANSYGSTSGAKWTQGDFDYDGSVNLNDLIILANNYGSSLGLDLPMSDFPADFQADLAQAFSGAAVPEPASATLLLTITLGVLARRRSRFQ